MQKTTHSIEPNAKQNHKKKAEPSAKTIHNILQFAACCKSIQITTKDSATLIIN